MDYDYCLDASYVGDSLNVAHPPIDLLYSVLVHGEREGPQSYGMPTAKFGVGTNALSAYRNLTS